MAMYKIEMMTNKDYFSYMTGGHYHVKYATIEAENAKEAISIAHKDFLGMIINEEYVKTVEELAAIEAEDNARCEEALKEIANKKAAKKQKEIEKAAALGMTEEEYKAYKKEEAKKRRYAREIKEKEEEIAKLKAEIAYRKKYLEKEGWQKPSSVRREVRQVEKLAFFIIYGL